MSGLVQHGIGVVSVEANGSKLSADPDRMLSVGTNEVNAAVVRQIAHLLDAGEDVLAVAPATSRERPVTHLVVTSKRLITAKSTLLLKGHAWGTDRSEITDIAWSDLSRRRVALRISEADGTAHELRLAAGDKPRIAEALGTATETSDEAMALIWSFGPNVERLEIWPDRLRWRGEVRAFDPHVRAQVTTTSGYIGDDGLGGGGMLQSAFQVVHPRWRVSVPINPADATERTALANQINLIVSGIGEQLSTVQGLLTKLGNETAAQSFADLTESAPRSPGLYSWWADASGTADLSAGLGLPVKAGLIYVGKTTRPLRTRILREHFGSNAAKSTVRRTLLAALGGPAELLDEAALTKWMSQHLRVVAEPVDVDSSELKLRETEVLRALDPPLNIDEMPPSPIRQELSRRRGKVRRAGDASSTNV